MQKLLSMLFVIAGLGLFSIPAAYTQSDEALCETTVREAFVLTGENCSGLGANQVCYGNGGVNALPRYVTADFDFETPGTMLGLNQVETISTQPLDTETNQLGVARVQVGGESAGFDLVMFGNSFAANSVLPALQVDLTVSTFTSIQSEASADSAPVGALVPGDLVYGTGRLNPNDGSFDVTADTWVRVNAPAGDGWIPAAVINEDYLVTSLTIVSPDETVILPMQAFTFAGGGADRACSNAVDSGMVVQVSSTEAVSLRINNVGLVLLPSTSLYLQAELNTAMSLYVLEGSINIESGEITRTVSAGQVVSVPVGTEGQANGVASPPSTYSQHKVAALSLVEPALPRDLVIEPGANMTLSSLPSGVIPPTVDAAGILPVSLITPENGIVVGNQLNLLFQTQPGIFTHHVDIYREEELIFSDSINTAGCSGQVCDVLIPYDGAAGSYSVWIQPILANFEGAWEGSYFQVGADGTATAAQISEEVVTNTPAGEAAQEVITAAPVVAEEQAAPPPAAAATTSAFTEAIQARGTVRIGVNGTLPSFSLEDNGSYSGFEVELARALATKLFGDSVTVEFTTVSARQRQNALADGSIDMMLRNTGFEEGRESWGEWTNTFYFIDGQRIIVRADSGITSLQDLAGRTVAVQPGTTAQTALEEAAETYGFTVSPIQGVITDAFAAFTNGQADALSADWTILVALANTTGTPESYNIVGDLLTEMPWNVVVPPGETEFLNEVETALLETISDGTWQNVYSANLNATLPDSVALLFTPVEGATAPATVAEETAPSPAAPTEVAAAAETGEEAAAPAPTAVPAGDIPLTGEIPVTIFTAEHQARMVRITPDGEGFLLELLRNGEIVYEGNYRYYENSGRYENVRSSFEYIEFSDTAGDTSLGCSRTPDISGFFNGAQFEGRLGC